VVINMFIAIIMSAITIMLIFASMNNNIVFFVF